MSRKRNHRMSRDTREMHQRGLLRALTDIHSFAAINQLHDDSAIVKKMNVIRASYIRMLEGNGDDRDFSILGGDINTCWIAAEPIAGGELVQQRLQAAGDALNEARRIKVEHGRYGLTGPGRIALGEGVDAIELVYRATSPVQMERAEQALAKSLRSQQRSTA